MTTGRGYRARLAALLLFTVAAGDFWRNLLSWYGWAAVCAVLFGAVLVELHRCRPSLQRLPAPLLVFLALATASLAWSAYPGATAAGLAATWVTTLAAAFLALCLPPEGFLAALSVALRWVLGLSLAFEAIVALLVRAPVLPLFPAFDPNAGALPDAFYWSRSALLSGGPIQGIVGNANLLAMIALVALIALAVQTAAGQLRRSRGWLWMTLAALTLAITQSATVLAAAAAAGVAFGLALLARRLPPAGRAALSWTAFGVIALAIAAGIVFGGQLIEFLRRNIDLTHRLDIWSTVSRLAAERPVQGWGWVSHWAPWTEPFDDLVVINGVTYLQAHNVWVDVHLQLGFLGLLTFGALAATVLVRSWWLATDQPHPGPGLTGPWRATTLLPLLVVSALLVQSLAESRILVEFGWTLFVALALSTKREQLPVGRTLNERVSEAGR
jgi:exopolysaccharide production protein ExoQ